MSNDLEHIALLLRLYEFLNDPIRDPIKVESWEKRDGLLEAINAYFQKRGLRVDYEDGIGLFLPKENKA